MKINIPPPTLHCNGQQGSSLVEVVVAIVISTAAIASTMNGYVLSSTRAEWSAHSLAAHSLAMQRMEQTRAAKWDTLASPIVDQVVAANFPTLVNTLDIPSSGTNIVYATNVTTITTLSANPALKMIRVDCIWPFSNHGLFTNTVITYRASDQ